MKEIPNFPGYYIDEDGTLYYKGRIRKPSVAKSGRKSFHIYDFTGKAHHKSIQYLILSAFVGEPLPGQVACLKDGNLDNISLDNLYWGTRGQAIKNIYNCKLTNADFTDTRVKRIYSRDKSVFQLDPSDLSVVQSYENVKEASKAIDVPMSVLETRLGNSKKTFLHYLWCYDFEYADMEEIDNG